MTKFWTGDAPKTCDTCSTPIDFTFYDASIPAYRGSWGSICSACFTKYNCTLGIGRGQEYQRMPDGRYACMKGGTLNDGGKAKTAGTDNASTG